MTQEGVRDLAGRYTDAVNRWDVDALGQCFAAEGVWDVVGIAKGEGRDEIVRVMTEAREGFDWVLQLLHSATVLDGDDHRARARVYATEWAHLNGQPTLLYWLYHDDCVVEEGHWRFARRTVDCLYFGPPDLSSRPATYPAPTR